MFRQWDKEDWDKYSAYLKTDRWKKKRDKVLRRDGYCCVLCTSIQDLEIHHRTYIRLYRERIGDLTTLCKRCHDGVTTMLRERKHYRRR